MLNTSSFQTRTIFSSLKDKSDIFPSPKEINLLGLGKGKADSFFSASPDEYFFEVFNRAKNPHDHNEILKLWLGRADSQLGLKKKTEFQEYWESSKSYRNVDSEWVLRQRVTTKFIKEIYNYFFRDDLYGFRDSPENIILSSGAVNEEYWGLSHVLKDCLNFAIEKDWYGYSDCLGRFNAREAIAEYESKRMKDTSYSMNNVALTMGATFSINSLADFLLSNNGGAQKSSALCGIPNYPPLIEAISRRSDVELVPLNSINGEVNVDSLVKAVRPDTPLIMIQTAINPTGASISEEMLEKLLNNIPPTTMVILDECHQFLGENQKFTKSRKNKNVIRVFSTSKTFSIPGLKIGWFLADENLIKDYYEFASSSYGCPPSFFYTLIEFTARMERWILEGIEYPEEKHLKEFESDYNLNLNLLTKAYRFYKSSKLKKEDSLRKTRDFAIDAAKKLCDNIIIPKSSINMLIKFDGYSDSYECYKDLIEKTNVALYPSLLCFCLSDAYMRLTTTADPLGFSKGLEQIENMLRSKKV